MSNEDLDFVKTRTKEAALSSYRNYKNNVPKHLSKEELLALQNLCKNKNIVIQKSGKGNSDVIVHKADYLDKMEKVLIDTREFEKINLKIDGILNFVVNQENRVDNILEKLFATNSILKKQGNLLNQLDLDQVQCMDFVNFTRTPSIIACLSDLFCQQLTLLPIN